jgi:hypothetical protein
MNNKQKQLIKIFKSLHKKLKRNPTRAEFVAAGISRDMIRHYFGNIDAFKLAALGKIKEKAPHIHNDFTKEALGTIIKENDYQEGTFFITAVAPTSHLDWSDSERKSSESQDVIGHNLFEPGFKAVQNFLKRNKAELVLLPMPAHVKALQAQPLHYDPALKEYKDNFATEFTFNTYLKAIEAHLNPQQSNPLTGLKRLRVHKYDKDNQPGAEIKKLKTSVIVAHSKQMLEVVPTGNESHPRLIHSTGAITKPSYLRNRIGMIANEDHKLGGLVVEIKGSEFWLRQVQFDVQDGSFVDMGMRYHADGKAVPERAEAFKMGDIHPGLHDDEALKAIYELWAIIKPKNIFFEDFFDGASISHHTEKKRLTRAQLPSVFKDLPTEILCARKTLKGIYSHAPKDAKLIATASNHPDHVMQYLDRGAYQNDCKANYDIGHRMVVMALDGKNPLKEYLDPENSMEWTDENKDLHIEGVQMNVHGHLGLNGARGGKQGHELAYSNVMVAHSHTPSIYHDCFTVGHTTQKRHGYNKGASSWILCSGAVYKGGQKQLYMIINGSAFRPRNKK